MEVIWLRNDRGRLVQVSREQVRRLQGDEILAPRREGFQPSEVR